MFFSYSKSKTGRLALGIALVYAVVSLCWITFSDEFLAWIVRDGDLRTKYSIVKGWAFVLVTGTMLYVLVGRLMNRWVQEVEAREKAQAARLQALESLRLNDTRTQRILEASSDGLWDWNIAADTTYVSPRYLEIVGCTGEKDPANAEFFRKLVHPDDWPAVETSMQEHLAGKTDQSAIEYRMISKDGTEKWIWGRGKVVERTPDGKPLRMVGTITDITERKRAEEQLRQSESTYRGVMDSLAEAVYIQDKNGTFIDVNQGAERMYGYSREELVGASPAIVSAEGKNDVVKVMTLVQLAYDGTPQTFEFWGRRKNGQIFPKEVSIYPGTYFGRKIVIAIARDISDRKLAEEQLRTNEEQLNTLINASPDIICLKDAAGRWLLANQSILNLYQIRNIDYRHKTEFELADYTAPIFQSAFKQCTDSDAKAWAAGGPVRTEEIIPSADGTLNIYDVIKVPIFHADGQRRGLIVIGRNITERKQAEKKLQENEEFIRNVLDSLTAHICVLDENGFIIAVNRAWEQFACDNSAKDCPVHVGVNYLEACRKSILLRHEAGAEAALEGIVAVIKGRRELFTLEYTCDSSTQKRWFLMQVLPFRNSRPGVLVRHENITERVLAEQALRESEERFRQLFNVAGDAFFLHDEQGRFVDVNLAACKSLGFSREELLQLSVSDIEASLQPEEVSVVWQKVNAGQSVKIEGAQRRKDGSILPVELHLSPFVSGEHRLLFVAARDITERRNLEKRMQQAQKIEAIGTLAGGIAHDFNNILAAMFGYACLLQQDTEGNAAAQEDIAEILKSANRAKDLVQQILTFSRQREQKPEIILLDTVVKEAVKFLRASLPAQIKIEVQLAPDTPPVLADPTQIYQVTLNLATNALHAMEGQCGCLTIRLESFEPDTDFIQSHPDLKPIQYARLTVADTGHGMDPQTLERIFEPFFTTKPVGKGTGLGLAVVHGIVQSHNGVIVVESEIGRGTSFYLYFPAQQPNNMPSAVAISGTLTGRGQRILVLDDEPALTAVLKRLLLRLNYQVTTSNNAREALSWCRENPAQFDLVLTDLAMPEINGLEVARQIRAIRQDLPIILTSGFCADLHRENLDNAGISELLEKPVSITELADALQRTFIKGGIASK